MWNSELDDRGLVLSGTINSGKPPMTSSARTWASIRPGSVCIQLACAKAKLDAPNAATKICALRSSPDGRGLQYNRRFLQMFSHYLVAPVACTTASGWERGQVENQIGLVRERFFTPRLRFKRNPKNSAEATTACCSTVSPSYC